MSRPAYIFHRSSALADETFTSLEALRTRLDALGRFANGGRPVEAFDIRWAVLSRKGMASTPCVVVSAWLKSGQRQHLGYVRRDGWAEAFLSGVQASLDVEPMRRAA